MTLRKKIVVAIIVMTTAALIGLIAVQVTLLKKATEQERQAFSQNVTSALNSIAQRLETREAVSGVFKVTVNIDRSEEGKRLGMLKLTAFDTSMVTDSLPASSDPGVLNPKFNFQDENLLFFLPTPQHVRILLLDSSGSVIESVVDEKKSAGEHTITLDRDKLNRKNIHVSFVSDSTSYVMNFNRTQTTNLFRFPSAQGKREVIVNRVIDELASRRSLPVEKRIDKAYLDSLVTATLLERGIVTPFAYGVVSSKSDSVTLLNKPNLVNEVKNSEFKARLFPHDIFARQDKLAIYFPQQRFYLLKQVALPVFISMLFILVLVFSFVYIIRVLFKQKQFSGRLTNFINNMTHEFKTPISTISLASESLTNPAVLNDRKKFEKYRRIISEENVRMRQQVEKILQMAMLEEQNYEFKTTKVHAHEIIVKAIENISPQIENRKGRIHSDLKASPAELEADPVHFANIIHNLLDNALNTVAANHT
ncbi:MAG: histidine kinase dimerization/phospho-acceptor domain-containing protein [bacterium]